MKLRKEIFTIPTGRQTVDRMKRETSKDLARRVANFKHFMTATETLLAESAVTKQPRFQRSGFQGEKTQVIECNRPHKFNKYECVEIALQFKSCIT